MGQAFVQATFSEALADTDDGERSDLDLLGDVGIFVCAVFGFVCQEQNTGTFTFALGVALGLTQAYKLSALGFGQRNVIFFADIGKVSSDLSILPG